VSNLLSIPRLRKFGEADEGQALVLGAVALVILMLMAGLGVDVGYLRYEKMQMQKAADAGAIAGASELIYGTVPLAKIAAQNDTTANGYTSGNNGVTVSVNIPPSSGPFAGDNSYVEVIVAQAQPTFFMRVGGFNTVNVRGRAVASSQGNSSGCIYVMDPSSKDTLTIKGAVSINSACGIRVNSSATEAVDKTGSGNITLTPQEVGIGIVGGIREVGSGNIDPTPITGIPHFVDPLANVPEPTPGGCTSQSGTVTGSGTVSLQPATFCSGITIHGSGTVNFASGTYILQGGGLTVTGSPTITGSGVTFYNTGNATYPYAPITITGSSGTTLSAPTSGSLEGILFFQDRAINACCGPTTSNSFDGSNGELYAGALYFPTTPLTYTGSTQLSAYSIIVGWQITMVGTVSMGDDYSSLTDGSPVRSAVLVE
jgi:Flp pilus assembly protein TadG